MTTNTNALREAWLTAAVKALRHQFHKRCGLDLPERIRVSCGWPSKGGTGKAKRVVGQCWSPTRSKDKATEVFLSPVMDDPVDVLAVLVHELVHAAVGTSAGHGPLFRRPAKAMGLEGKMTATEPSAEMKVWLVELACTLGQYPHKALGAGYDSADLPKKQNTRMVKCACPDCGYTLRTTRKWLDVATPRCPTHDVEMAVEGAS